MKSCEYYILGLIILSFISQSFAQAEETAKYKIEQLQKKKAGVAHAEREALKLRIIAINDQLEKGAITTEEADLQKKETAKKHALNIDDRVVIIEKHIALLQRNNGVVLEESIQDRRRFSVGLGRQNNDNERFFGILIRSKKPQKTKVDKRTYSDLVVSFGLNSALREGESLSESPFGIVSSHFLELGWSWRYRLTKNSNALRFHYGFLFQRNQLEMKERYFDANDRGKIELFSIDKKGEFSKLVAENLVLQFHLETGPSKMRNSGNSVRYSIKKQLRFGLGGYFGFPIELWQRFSPDFNKVEQDNQVKDETNRIDVWRETEYDFRTNNLVYGVSCYAGVGGFLLYAKYDLSSTFRNAVVKQNNISLGLRFDL